MSHDNFSVKNKGLSMVMLIIVLIIFLVGVSSVLALYLWPDMFGHFLFFSN
jgi:flagellar basal body-associated protein FliL